jgi:DNA recombination protein RmuC
MIIALFFALFSLFLALFFIYIKKSLQKDFQSSSYQLFQENAQNFLELAKSQLSQEQEKAQIHFNSQQKAIDHLLDPMRKTLDKLQEENHHLETKREKAFATLEQQIRSLVLSEQNLSKETANLSKALSSPNVRGNWGQIHLQRAIELAGLQEHCDFELQKSVLYQEEVKRPDLVIQLPGQRQIIVDAKTPLEAYLRSFEMETEEGQKEKLKQHAKQLRKHIQELSQKEYFKTPTSIECVILFLPADAIFESALKVDPLLLENALTKGIVLATPSSLFAILKAVAFTWRQDAISENAQKIAEIGTELYDRLKIMVGHFEKVGRNLQTSVDAYNQTVSSMDSRVFVSAKKLQSYMKKSQDQLDLKKIEKEIKGISSS